MSIEDTLTHHLQPTHLEVIDESPFHGQVNSHYKIVIASPAFEGKTLIERHRMLYAVLKDLGAHALSLHAFTPEEWEEEPRSPSTPNCLGF